MKNAKKKSSIKQHVSNNQEKMNKQRRSLEPEVLIIFSGKKLHEQILQSLSLHMEKQQGFFFLPV